MSYGISCIRDGAVWIIFWARWHFWCALAAIPRLRSLEEQRHFTSFEHGVVGSESCRLLSNTLLHTAMLKRKSKRCSFNSTLSIWAASSIYWRGWASCSVLSSFSFSLFDLLRLADDEVHLYAVSATNLLFIKRAKRSSPCQRRWAVATLGLGPPMPLPCRARPSYVLPAPRAR